MLGLPALYREALSLRNLVMGHGEIGQQIGRTESNCRKIVQRGLQLLQAALAGGA